MAGKRTVRRPNETDPTNLSTATDLGAILMLADPQQLLNEKSDFLSVGLPGSGGVLIRDDAEKPD
jgi:hypothetical protein